MSIPLFREGPHFRQEFVTLQDLLFEPEVTVAEQQTTEATTYKAEEPTTSTTFRLNCSVVPAPTIITTAECFYNASSFIGASSSWLGTSEDVLYLALPSVLVVAALGALLALAVLVRLQLLGCRAADCYMTSFTLVNLLLLAAGTLTKIEDYIGHQNWFQEWYGHIKSLYDWLCCTSVWLLVIMVLERASVVSQHKKWSPSSDSPRPSSCSPLQSLAVTVMVALVCGVSALPQIWEWEPTYTFDFITNKSVLIAQKSSMATSPTYELMYFWYLAAVRVLLPYPLLLLLCAALLAAVRQSQRCRSRMPITHGAAATDNVLNKKVSSEAGLSRLLVVMSLMYVLLTVPIAALRLVHHVGWLDPRRQADEDLYQALLITFTFMFYVYFALHFPLLCCYHERFRSCLLRASCCHGNGAGDECHFTPLKQTDQQA